MSNLGATNCLIDITNGLSRDEIRVRWKRGDYGTGSFRPKPEHVDGWLKLKGR